MYIYQLNMGVVNYPYFSSLRVKRSTNFMASTPVPTSTATTTQSSKQPIIYICGGNVVHYIDVRVESTVISMLMICS